MTSLIVITGANGAHGQEIAAKFANHGHRLILTDIHPNSLNKDANVSAQTQAYIAADLENTQELERLVKQVLDIEVPEIVINNAGIFPFDDILDISLNNMQKTLAINLQAPFYLMQTLGGAMAKKGHGTICNISSAAASVSRRNGAVYGASKAGLEQLTKTFAIVLGPSGVRVNAVRPGLRAENTVQTVPLEHANRLAAAVPLQRFSKAGEVASMVYFLCSQEAGFVTGQIVSVDGGSDLNRRR